MKKSIFKILLASALLISAAGCSTFKKPAPDQTTAPQGMTLDQAENQPVDTQTQDSAQSKVVPEAKTPDAPAKQQPAKTETVKPEAQKPEAQKQEAVPAPVTPKPVVKNFNMTAKQFEFVPNTITVNEGDTVRINIKSTDVTHGFLLTEFGINKTIPAGSTVTVEFVANKKGTFTFQCSVYCGEDHVHMKGTLVVQ